MQRSRGRRPKKKKEFAAKLLQLSITISTRGDDIYNRLLGVLKDLSDKETDVGICSLERGGIVFHLHFQIVVRKMVAYIVVVSKKIKNYLGWDVNKPAGARIMWHTLTQKKLHTFQGMVGYCMKDLDKPHYQECIP